MATEKEPIIKVKLVFPESSKFRGVGVYATNLIEALKDKSDQIQIVEDSPHLVHYPFFDLFQPTLPLMKSFPTLVTVHDLTPLVLDTLYPKGLKSSLNLWRQRLALGNVDAILTDSENSKADIQRIFGLGPKKIFVTPLGVSPFYFAKQPIRKLNSLAKRLNLPSKFVLTVAGGPNPNKNLVRLAEATQTLDLPLLIAGRGMLENLPEGPVHAELLDLSKLKKFDHLILPGFVSEEDLAGLYNLATVYCQASLYEGFGLPLLEAMAAGCLIVSSNTSSLPEIYPTGTITFDPNITSDISSALERALKLDRNEVTRSLRAGRAKAAQFTWEATAALTIKAYQWVYENKYRNY